MSTEVLLFNNTKVEIKRRAFKRSIGITLHVSGRIQVSAPKMTSLSRINAFLLQNSEWIKKNLASYEALRSRFPRKTFAEGETFLFLGSSHVLRYVCGVGNRISVGILNGDLRVEVPPQTWKSFVAGSPHPEMAKPIARFYEASARKLLEERIALKSEAMRQFPKSVSFRSQKTRWGSCSSRGTLSFNWRLIIAPLAVIDYVIVHELAHLKYHNHSKAFWNLVATQIPEYPEYRDWLRTHQYEADFLSRESELHSV